MRSSESIPAAFSAHQIQTADAHQLGHTMMLSKGALGLLPAAATAAAVCGARAKLGPALARAFAGQADKARVERPEHT